MARLTDGDDVSGPNKAKRRKLQADSLPSNYASLSTDELKAICAAHGFLPKGTSKSQVLHEIENELHGDKDLTPLMLTGGPGKTAKEDDEDDENDADFQIDLTADDE